MELIKKQIDVKDAKGWYLLQNEKRAWKEDFIDEDTGELVSVDRSENICEKGALLNELLISLLLENGITMVNVSNIPLLGEQVKFMNLWEVQLKVTEKGSKRKKSYIVTADSPSQAEKFINEYFTINIDAVFELVKVNQVEYNKVIKLYDIEREEYEASGVNFTKWYKCKLFSVINDDETETNGGSINLLVLAMSFESAISAAKSVLTRNEFDNIYNTFKEVQELNIIDVFIPDESASYYSNSEIK